MSLTQLKATGIDIFQNIDPNYAADDLQSAYKILLNPIPSQVSSIETSAISVTNNPNFIEVLFFLY